MATRQAIMDPEKINTNGNSQGSDTQSQEAAEKKAYSIDVNDASGIDVDGDDQHQILDNKFPFPPLHGIPDEDRQLTFRALIVGCALGAIVSASNLYLGLKTGWTFGASLFGGILGFAIIKPLSRVAPKFLGGGYFGPKVCSDKGCTSIS